MARTKQNSSRKQVTHQDLLQEARTTHSNGYSHGRDETGPDGVRRYVGEDGILRLYRFPGRTPSGYDEFRERFGKRIARVYKYDDESSSPRRSPRKSPRKATLPTRRRSRIGYQHDNDSEESLPRKVRFRPGTVALRDIRKYQGRTLKYWDKDKKKWEKQHIFHKTATQLFIPKQSFQRVVRDIALDFKKDVRFEVQAIEALQEAAESHLVAVFQDANIGAIHNGRETVMVRDMRLAGMIRRDAKADVVGGMDRGDGVPQGG